ncbi:MAG: hypothetical protein IKH61_10655 [Bacteroidales bacterium]|nr:hypothetical protein [Bacteroidales bacterium]
MEKENKLIILKSLIIAVFLILGNTALAQHPLLSDDELNVYAGPCTTVTIGKQANDEGRTCYKWRGYFGENGIEERIGSKQEFDLPLYMTPNESYEFLLTVIGEQYYQQTVTLHIVGQATFIVYPKRGCFSGNEMPRIEDFEIITNPRGFENLVSIVGMHPHTQNVIDGYYDVFFNLTVGGEVLDQKSVTIVNTDALQNTIWVNFEKLNDFCSGLMAMTNAAFNGLQYIPGGWVRVAPTSMVSGNFSITKGYDCCNYPVRQTWIDLDNVGIKQQILVEGGFNWGVLRLGVHGGLEFGIGLSNVHTYIHETCRGNYTNSFDVSFYAAPMLGLFVKDGTGGYVIKFEGDLFFAMGTDNLHLSFPGDDSVVFTGTAYLDFYAKLKIQMFSFYTFEPPKISFWRGEKQLRKKICF